MKDLTLPSGTKLTLYNSIQNLPIHREHEFKKLLLQDAQVGSDMGSVANHLSMLHKYASHGQNASVMQEAINLHNNYFLIISGIDTTSLCFAALVNTIGSKHLSDLSPENAKKTVENLSKQGLTYEIAKEVVDEVKKKLLLSFNPIFLTDMEQETQTL